MIRYRLTLEVRNPSEVQDLLKHLPAGDRVVAFENVTHLRRWGLLALATPFVLAILILGYRIGSVYLGGGQ